MQSVSTLRAEFARWWSAALGLVLWVAYPFLFPLEKQARWAARCAGRKYEGQFDNCFSDALPVDQLIIVPGITILLAYFFARFAFTIYAPPSHLRRLDWRLAGSTGGAESYPVLQIMAASGLLWSLYRLSGLPLEMSHWYLFTYWTAWALWFTAAAIASLPSMNRDELIE